MSEGPRPGRPAWVALGVLVLAITAASTWWANHQEARTARAVAARAATGDLHMLASDHCGICTLARAWMQQHGVAFTECSIERDAACRAAFAATGSPGTPVFVVRRQTLVGFNPERLLAALPER